jgi:hypothetical protein
MTPRRRSTDLNYHFLITGVLALLFAASVYAFVAVVVMDVIRGMR